MYTGTKDLNDFNEFLFQAFTFKVMNVDNRNIHTSYSQFILQLKRVKKLFENISTVDEASIIVPQMDIDEEMNATNNVFSSSYKPISVFEYCPIAIYFPLFNVTVLFKYTNPKDLLQGYKYYVYEGFILRDSTEIPHMDTNIYFYKLNASQTGEVLFRYIDKRYHIYNLLDGYKYEFMHGFNKRLIELSMDKKIYFYQVVLDSMMKEIVECSLDINFINSEFELIKKKEE